MKNCRQYRYLIAGFVDGTASEAEAARLAEHRAECAHCDVYARELKRTRDLVRGLPRLEPSSSMMPAMSARLQDQKVSWWERLFWAFRMSDMRVPAAVTVCLVLLIGVGMVAVRGVSPVAAPSVAHAPATHLEVYQPPAVTTVMNGSKPLDDYYVSCERYHQAYASPDDVQLASY